MSEAENKAKEVFDEAEKIAKDSFDAVKGETKEVIAEAKAVAEGKKLESQEVGAAGYREAEPKSNGLAVAALVIGILSIIFAFTAVWLGLILGIVGVVLGANARKKHQTSMATAGFVCSLLGLIFSAVMLVCGLVCLGSLASAASLLEEM